MVPFGGFEMPVQYSGLGVSASHHFTREKASLFDVGHMVQHRFEGPGAAAFLQRITPGSIASLPTHQSTLSALLWPATGGIVDDTIITRLGPALFYVVTNAACREKDLKYLAEQLDAWKGAEVKHEILDGWGLIALQGPLAEELLTQILENPGEANLRNVYFGQSVFASVKGASNPVLISRGGYTGEDGFEISIAPPDTVAVTQTLLDAAGPDKLQLAGLGARDSLRLEAGMCLYGHDLDDTTTPVEGALGWIVGRDRRNPKSEDEKFHGADVVLAQLTPKSKGGSGVTRRRVGLVVEGAPAREGAEIVSVSSDGSSTKEEKIGVVTSGCPSPTLRKNIAMGYIKDGLHKAGTEVQVLVRGKPRKAVVTKMPFVPAKYYKEPAPAS
ncbi:glycine cleavage system T protein [Xylariaceae sp. FL0594]|nr:glycine cleavage system T protein [Xylariaceae sp. FL0594]